jgi:hypothetical protein
MANFNLENYETVEQRHARALEAYPDLRCVIVNHTTENDRAQAMWVVEARVYMNAEDQAADLPKATEWAFEVDGVGMANKTSALENACTSALGRALRWAFAGSKGPSREEMQKVARAAKPVAPPADLEAQLAQIPDTIELQKFYESGLALGWMNDQVRALFTARKSELKGA